MPRTIRIVLVDDHDPLRQLSRLWIEHDERYVVVGEAASGSEAINVVGEQQPDVVLLDVAMPEMDGLSALPFLKSVSPATVIVVYTNHEQYGPVALKKGAAAVYDKADPMAAMLDGIASLVVRSPCA